MRGLIAAFALCASQAQALSCLPVDPAGSYIMASRSDKTYTLVRGALLGRPDLPPRDMTDPQPVQYRAQFFGHQISASGFDLPFDTDVTVTELCAGIWCATVPDDFDAIYFLRQTDAGWALDEGPCGGWVFSEPELVLEDFKRCARGGHCQPEFRR